MATIKQAPVAVERADLIHALKTQGETFINFFLPELAFDVPKFHLKIWNFMTLMSIIRTAIAVPRGHAKTTLAKLSCVYFFLFSDVRFIVYVSNTSVVAVAAVADIIGFMETPNFVKVFGAIKFRKRNEGEGYFDFMLGDKRCILKSRGAGQQIRGINVDNQRPQLAIVDDLEDSDNTDTAAAQKKLDQWFLGTFIKCMDETWNKVIYIGNMVSNTCLLKRLLKLRRWRSMLMGAVMQDGSPLWPDLWPIKKLAEDYAEYVELDYAHLWFAEMMNQPIAGDNALIKPENINYMQPCTTEDLAAGFITIDPATGDGTDNTAIAVHGLVDNPETESTVCQTVDHVSGKLDELATIDEAVILATRWGIRIIGIEAVAYQKALKSLFHVILVSRGIYDIEVVCMQPGITSKLKRLRAYAAAHKSGQVALSRGDLTATNELLNYDPMKKNNSDDLIDALAYTLFMIQNYMPLIMSKGVELTLEHKPSREQDVCYA